MTLNVDEIIRRLRTIDPDLGTAFRKLCTQAHICSMCCQPWDADGNCPCIAEAVR